MTKWCKAVQQHAQESLFLRQSEIPQSLSFLCASQPSQGSPSPPAPGIGTIHCESIPQGSVEVRGISALQQRLGRCGEGC